MIEVFRHTATIVENGFTYTLTTIVTTDDDLQIIRTTRNGNGVITVVSSVAMQAGTEWAAQKLAEVKARFGIVDAPVETEKVETVKDGVTEQAPATMHEMIRHELAAVSLQIGDLRKPGTMYRLSNGRLIWTQPLEQDEPIEDVFNARQNAVTMTVPCPECYGETHAIYTHVEGVRQAFRKCSRNAAHTRVRVA